ncbi:hypothetical protein KI387_038423, partial [Taxus chinensis]
GERDDDEEDEPEVNQEQLVFSVHDSEEGEGEKNGFIFHAIKGSQEKEGIGKKEGREAI